MYSSIRRVGIGRIFASARPFFCNSTLRLRRASRCWRSSLIRPAQSSRDKSPFSRVSSQRLSLASTSRKTHFDGRFIGARLGVGLLKLLQDQTDVLADIFFA